MREVSGSIPLWSTMKKKFAIITLIAVAILIFYTIPHLKKETTFRVDVELIREQVLEDRAVLLDVRTEEERENDGYILESTHFDLAWLEEGKLPEINKDKKIYIHCRGGGRAGTAQAILEKNGFTDAENIGGLSDWENAGGEISR